MRVSYSTPSAFIAATASPRALNCWADSTCRGLSRVDSMTESTSSAYSGDSRSDSHRLAVQGGQRAHLVDLDGRESGSVEIPAGRELAAGVGWSPDGGLLATVRWIGQ